MFDLRYVGYKLWKTFEKLLFAPFPAMRGMYKGVDFATHTDILRRIKVNPDYVIVCTYQHFLSPHSLYLLHEHTKATFFFVMCDEKILGGGCPYPMSGCQQYTNGCRNCPYYPYGKFIPQKIYKEKEKYFSFLPFHLYGVRYDLEKAKLVTFLENKVMHAWVANPSVPFVLKKEDARHLFNLSQDDFIIMCGAVNLNDWKKGFKELWESLYIFSEKIRKDRNVTLIVLSKSNIEVQFPANIKIKFLGFLDLNNLFSAFYACDVYVSPSVMDSGPMMVNYAIACGRPVVAFPVGVSLDLVIHQETGWLASLQDTIDYANGLTFFYNCNQQQLQQIEEKCKAHIKSCSDNLMKDDSLCIFREPVNT